MIVVKKWLLLGGLSVGLLFSGWQPVYASEDAASNASIVFYDRTPTPNPPTNGGGQATNPPIKKPANQTLPKTNEKPISFLYMIIGSELILLVWILIWKRRKEEEEDEQITSRD